MTPASQARGPHVRFPPPLLFIGGLAISWGLERRLGFAIDGDGAGFAQATIGIMLISIGLGVATWAIVTFVLARTAVFPNQPARQLVTDGPYGFTRNPMYTGLTVAYVGVAVVWNVAWPMVVLPLVLGCLYVFVVRLEERYLRAEFSDAYDAYRRRVRRWI